MAFHPLVQKISENISQHQLLEKGDTVLVCVSGGSDSIALLHLLLDLQNQWNIKLHLLHFDHGLRRESPAERQFVEDLAQQYNLPCHTSVAKHLAQESSGIQEKSRQWRLRISENLRREIGGQRIATAHHADDQAETFLHKLLRGCHLSNLRGMAWQNGFSIRPLLNCEKSELQQYLQNKSQQWMEDPSNQSLQYLRNRIRLELLPLMNELARGDLPRRLHDLSEQSEQLQQWIDQTGKNLKIDQINQSASLSIEDLIQTPFMVQNTLLHQYLTSQGIKDLNYRHLQKIFQLLQKDDHQWELHLPGKKTIRREGKQLFVSSFQTVVSQITRNGPLEIANNLGTDWQIQCQRLAPSETIPSEGITLFNIPPKRQLTFCYRKPGDRFHPPWKRKPVKLKDFLRDQGIPLHQRNQIPLIDDGNEILSIYPYYLAQSTSHDQKKYPPVHISITFKAQK